MKDKVAAFAKSRALWQAGDAVCAALSGGADSVALLRVLLELAPQEKISITACHVNHCLRGAESDGDEEFCRELCAAFSVPLAVRRCDVPAYCAAHGVSVEEGARILRYEALEEASDGALIATAHHLGDNAETVLLNLLRGTALDGLCGIPVRRGRIIRPLLTVTRDEITAYLAALGQPCREDSTNLENDAARNRLRHEVIPVLEAVNPAFLRTAGAMTESLSADRALLDSLLDDWWAQNVSGGLLPRDAYEVLHEALRLRALRRLLRESGAAVTRTRLLACDAMLLAGEGSYPLAKDLTFCADERGGRVFIRKAPFVLPEMPVDLRRLPARIPLSPGKLLEIRMLSRQERKLFVNNRSERYKNAIDCDTIRHPAALRARRAGDLLRPVGRGCTKSLKKLFAESGIPAESRGGIAVLADGEGPVWAEGFGVREASALTERTETALFLNIINSEET